MAMTTLSALTSSLSRLSPRREWVAVVAVVAMTGLAWTCFEGPRTVKQASPAQGWVGELAVTAASGSSEAKPLSSSSLVIPSTELALPAVAKAPLQVKNACDSADDRCAVRPLAVVAPSRRQASATDGQARPVAVKRAPEVQTVSLASPPAEKKFSLNPLDHLPDAATLGRPFEAAGSMVSGWVRRL